MNQYRNGELGNSHFELRSGRFFQKEDRTEWYLQTREGIELGPFESHAEAAVCLNQYLDFVNGASEDEIEQFCKIYAAA